MALENFLLRRLTDVIQWETPRRCKKYEQVKRFRIIDDTSSIISNKARDNRESPRQIASRENIFLSWSLSHTSPHQKILLSPLLTSYSRGSALNIALVLYTVCCWEIIK